MGAVLRRRRRQVRRHETSSRRRIVKKKKKKQEESIDLYKVLGIVKDGDRISGGRSRCFRQFHRRSVRYEVDAMRTKPEADRKFSLLCLALVTLTDDARREIYDRSGMSALRASEKYNAIDIFELDPIVIFDRFFEAQDPVTGQPSQAVKEYLLLEAGASSPLESSSSSVASDPPSNDEMTLPPNSNTLKQHPSPRPSHFPKSSLIARASAFFSPVPAPSSSSPPPPPPTRAIGTSRPPPQVSASPPPSCVLS